MSPPPNAILAQHAGHFGPGPFDHQNLDGDFLRVTLELCMNIYH